MGFNNSAWELWKVEGRQRGRLKFKVDRKHEFELDRLHLLTEYYDEGHFDRLNFRPGYKSPGGGSSGVPGGSLA